MIKNPKEYIENYFQGKDLGVSIIFNGQMHYFSTEALLEATLSSEPEVHKFIAEKLQLGSRKTIKNLMESIAETIVKEHMAG